MTVKELVDIMDKRIMFSVFEAANNELLFDSTQNGYTRKGWDYVKNRNVLQLSNNGNGEEAEIYIEMKNKQNEDITEAEDVSRSM